MTTQQLYQKTLNEQITPNEFLWSVRKDPQYGSILNNLMSYEDTVSVLKAKGYISDSNSTPTEVKSFDLIGSIRSLNEAAKKQKLKGGKGDKMTPDQVNYYEFRKGWKHEMEHTDDIDKAKEIALDHLCEDPMYYTRLEMIEFKGKKKERADLPIDISKKKASMKDEKNQMVPHEKKKEASNVSDQGKKEKATSKNAGIKKMKGGSGEMKSLKEADGDDDDIFNFSIEDIKKRAKEELKQSKAKSEPKTAKTSKSKSGDDKSTQTVSGKEGETTDSPEDTGSDKKGLFKVIDAKRTDKENEEAIKKKQYKEVMMPQKVFIVNYKLLLRKNAGESLYYPKIPFIKIEPVDATAKTFLADLKAEQSQKTKASKKTTEPKTSEPAVKKEKKPVPPTVTTKDNTFEVDIIVDGRSISKYQTIPKRIFKTITGVDPENAEVGKTYRIIKSPKTDKIYPGEAKKAEVKIIKDNEVGQKRSGWSGIYLSDTERKLPKEDQMALIKKKKEDMYLSDKEKTLSQAKKDELVNKRSAGTMKKIADPSITTPGDVKYDPKSIIDKNRLSLRKNMPNPEVISKKSYPYYVVNKNTKQVIGLNTKEAGKDYVKQNPNWTFMRELEAKAKGYLPISENKVSKGSLIEYIRSKIKSILAESDEGPYIGVSGPDVVKKKLEDYLKRYSSDWRQDPSPKQREVGAEYEGIISKLVADLNNSEPNLGTAIYNKHVKEPLNAGGADQDLAMPTTLAYDPTKLVSRGGRIAENDSPSLESILKIADDVNSQGSTTDLTFAARVLGDYIAKANIDYKNKTNEDNKIINAFLRAVDKKR